MTYQILFLGSPLLLAAIAQGVCIRYECLSRLRRALDLGLHFRGRRIFGDHKTWRGLVINVFFCTVGAMIQTWFQTRGYLPQWLPLLDYGKYGYFIGLLLGLGMTLGELPNSFVKRQLDIPPGRRKRGIVGVVFIVFDQVDLGIGIWALLFFVIRPHLLLVLWSFLMIGVLHVCISCLGYVLGMRKTVA